MHSDFPNAQYKVLSESVQTDAVKLTVLTLPSCWTRPLLLALKLLAAPVSVAGECRGSWSGCIGYLAKKSGRVHWCIVMINLLHT
jgi:hypothetical protein